MSKRFKSRYDLDTLEYWKDLTNYLNIYRHDNDSFVGIETAVNVLVTGLLNKIDQLEEKVDKLEKLNES